jgi:acyl dehydratase
VGKVVEKKESRKEGQGMVTFMVDVVNQNETSVMKGQVKVIIKKRL